ncbi:hypothetical protein [Collinsella ihumii]|uniref:Uncharacterized protein n=1 Tax=Collinsella ihumii TaxID=1720204 RepID=A0ABT7XC92_9ACTN|nr:hypothetical protein [Collinsella ihumii]MDN0063026.1 hypothetical protein [Collinsella ihumii]
MGTRKKTMMRTLAVASACCAVVGSAAVLGASRTASADPVEQGVVITLGAELSRRDGMITYAVGSYRALDGTADPGEFAPDLTVIVPEPIAEDGASGSEV